jgi:hypothetical protein
VRDGTRVCVRDIDAQVSKVHHTGAFATGSAPTSPRATQNRRELRFDRGGRCRGLLRPYLVASSAALMSCSDSASAPT